LNDGIRSGGGTTGVCGGTGSAATGRIRGRAIRPNFGLGISAFGLILRRYQRFGSENGPRSRSAGRCEERKAGT